MDIICFYYIHRVDWICCTESKTLEKNLNFDRFCFSQGGFFSYSTALGEMLISSYSVLPCTLMHFVWSELKSLSFFVFSNIFFSVFLKFPLRPDENSLFMLLESELPVIKKDDSEKHWTKTKSICKNSGAGERTWPFKWSLVFVFFACDRRFYLTLAPNNH